MILLFWPVKLPECIPLSNYFTELVPICEKKKRQATISNKFEPISPSLYTHTQILPSHMRARVFKLTHTESQGCQQELERRLATNTYICTHTHTHRVHSYRTQIKLWQWESEHRLPRQSGEPPTAEQSHKKKKKKDKIDRWNWRKIKMFMALSPSGLYLWLVWLISFSFISLPFLYLLPRSVRLLISQPRHLATPAPDWLLGFLSFFLSHAAFSRFPLVFRLFSVCEVWWKPTGMWRRRI